MYIENYIIVLANATPINLKKKLLTSAEAIKNKRILKEKVAKQNE